MEFIDMNFELEILTASSVADIINGILEFLLYQRNQIPFTYKIYEYYVNQWNSKDLLDDTERPAQLNMQRQREEAKRTKDAINSMQQVITKLLEQNIGNIKSFRFLLGATTFTPKEVYTIHIPKTIARSYCSKNHRISDSQLNKTLLALLTSKKLFGIFSKDLCPTNLFLELVTECQASNDNKIIKINELNIFPKEISQLPRSCKEVHLRLQHTQPVDYATTSSPCCQKVKVFEDLETDNSKFHPAIKSESTIQGRNANELDWWEADLIIRGFREKPIKGVNLWGK